VNWRFRRCNNLDVNSLCLAFFYFLNDWVLAANSEFCSCVSLPIRLFTKVDVHDSHFCQNSTFLGRVNRLWLLCDVPAPSSFKVCLLLH
jgi:hypothetical protein